jgi:hypothetical protein
VLQILSDVLGMKKFSIDMVSRLLTDEQNLLRLRMFAELIGKLTNGFLAKTITGDGT